MGWTTNCIGIRAAFSIGAVVTAAGLALGSTGNVRALNVGHTLLIGLIGNGAIHAPALVYVSRRFDCTGDRPLFPPGEPAWRGASRRTQQCATWRSATGRTARLCEHVGDDTPACAVGVTFKMWRTGRLSAHACCAGAGCHGVSFASAELPCRPGDTRRLALAFFGRCPHMEAIGTFRRGLPVSSTSSLSRQVLP